MRPTRRGYGVVGVALLSVWLALLFGARSLNAVVVPCLVVLLGGAVQLYRAAPPALDRSQPEPGFPGETRTVELTIESSVPCRVTDLLGPGVTAAEPTVETAGDATYSYEVDLERRGEWTIGPAVVVATDAFGLLKRSFTNPKETHVLVYPELRPLAGPVGIEREASAVERGAFERIREYQPGDPLRDVHWKSSAKRPAGDLVVAEYTGDEAGGVEIAAGTRLPSRDAVDELVAATASIAVTLLDEGVPVSVEVANDRIEQGVGERHRGEVLALLARASSGALPEDHEADVRVVVAADGAHVFVHDRDRPFEELVTGATA
jgi:uncharacterized protein (DUF58 family)